MGNVYFLRLITIFFSFIIHLWKSQSYKKIANKYSKNENKKLSWEMDYRYTFITSRSSRPEVFCKKGVLGNFTIFTGKHLCQSLFLNKDNNFIKKETLAQVLSCEFYEFSKYTFS